MVLKRLMVLTLSMALILVLVFSAGKTLAKPLDQIIAGAKKEGAVVIKIHSAVTAKAMNRLEKEIREKFDANLKITFSPTESMTKAMANLLMEHKAGISPSLDLINLSHHAVLGLKVGALERVDWKSLITDDINPAVVLTNPAYFGSIVFYTSHQGLLFNPKKISPEKVPKSFEDMAKPQWKGKIGIPSATSGWTRRAFVLGKEKVFDELRGILKNDVILGRYSTLHNRFQLEEIWMAFTISSYWHYAITKGVPVAWQSLDYAEVPYYVLAVTKGSKHPNAAKLVAVYLASPAGAKFMLEESGTGNLFYPGNFENDFSVQNKKQGIREVFTAEDMKLINFIDSKDFNAWGKELKLLIDTGGTAKNKKKK